MSDPGVDGKSRDDDRTQGARETAGDGDFDAVAAAEELVASLGQEPGEAVAEQKAEYLSTLEAEVAELNARADSDIMLAGSRVGEELRAEIARLANAATEQALAGGAVDAATQQDLIESFIQKVGAAS